MFKIPTLGTFTGVSGKIIEDLATIKKLTWREEAGRKEGVVRHKHVEY